MTMKKLTHREKLLQLPKKKKKIKFLFKSSNLIFVQKEKRFKNLKRTTKKGKKLVNFKKCQ